MAMLNSQRVMLNINHVLKYSNFDHQFVHELKQKFREHKIVFCGSNIKCQVLMFFLHFNGWLFVDVGFRKPCEINS